MRRFMQRKNKTEFGLGRNTGKQGFYARASFAKLSYTVECEEKIRDVANCRTKMLRNFCSPPKNQSMQNVAVLHPELELWGCGVEL